MGISIYLAGGTSTFSWRGEALPFLPYSDVKFLEGPTVFEIHAKSLRRIGEHPDAPIVIEQIVAPVLMLCGGRDIVWPSCEMAAALEERAKSRGKSQSGVVRLPDADHGVLGPPSGPDSREEPLITRLTRTSQQDQAARKSASPKVDEFLRSAMVGTRRAMTGCGTSTSACALIPPVLTPPTNSRH